MDLRGSIGGFPAGPRGTRGIQGIPWGHGVGLMSSMRTRDLFWSHWGLMGGAWGSQRVKGSI